MVGWIWTKGQRFDTPDIEELNEQNSTGTRE